MFQDKENVLWLFYAAVEAGGWSGAHVDYNDPHVPQTHRMRHHDLQMKSVELTPDNLKGYDCILIATHHQAYDWQMVADNAKLIVDTRNAMNGVKGKRDHIVFITVTRWDVNCPAYIPKKVNVG